MPGAGSSLDRNDYRLVQQLVQEIRQLNDNLEEFNDTLSSTDDQEDDG